MVRLADRTLIQHCGHDGYGLLTEAGDPNPVDDINARVRELLVHDGEATLWDVMSARNIFATSPERLDRWLEATGSRRVVFGHTPHGGRVINFDGAFSRSHRKFRTAPIGATVAPLGD